MRCVPSKDKSKNFCNLKYSELILISFTAMAMGIVQFSLGVFANIPCPNIYAGIVNASCIVWHKLCGQSGYCSLYDSDTFRINFFGKIVDAEMMVIYNNFQSSCFRFLMHINDFCIHY